MAVCHGSPSVRLDGTLLAVVSNKVRADLATAGELPLTERRRPETPATKGVAIEVPDRTAKPPRARGIVEMMFPPGAATAGLKWKSLDGP